MRVCVCLCVCVFVCVLLRVRLCVFVPACLCIRLTLQWVSSHSARPIFWVSPPVVSVGPDAQEVG